MDRYDYVVKLCEEALDYLEQNSIRKYKVEDKPTKDEDMAKRGRELDADVEFSSVVELVERVEKSLSDYKALLEKYEELADVEDLEFEDIATRVDTILDKLEKFVKRQV